MIRKKGPVKGSLGNGKHLAEWDVSWRTRLGTCTSLLIAHKHSNYSVFKLKLRLMKILMH